jgi:hypothetical protein
VWVPLAEATEYDSELAALAAIEVGDAPERDVRIVNY